MAHSIRRRLGVADHAVAGDAAGGVGSGEARGAGEGRRVMAARRSSARADDFAKTFASIRRQLRRIPTDHRRRAELFTTLTYVARLYVRREIRSAPRPQTPEDALRGAGIDDARQAKYQRKFSTLLAGKGRA